ncbi:hypothetical protein [Sphingomonas sp. IW22]|uniref:hypothetical protein n=1 Tax=Sphingomonas sp. IW22 TaxID=3242489 RepID=UPI003520CEB7
MEYPDAINTARMQRAVDLALHLNNYRSDNLSVLVGEAVDRTFCTCVTYAEDAAEGRLSGIHKALIDAVMAKVLTERDQSSKDEQT